MSHALTAALSPPPAVTFLGGVGIVAFVVVIVWLAYIAFGPVVLGVPAMIAVLVAWTLTTLLSNAGAIAVGFVVIGILLVWLIIGMAMSAGPEGRGGVRQEMPEEPPGERARDGRVDEPPQDDSRDSAGVPRNLRR